jgi:hypothetical protein
MPAIETIKLTEKATGWSRPRKAALDKLVRPRKAQTRRFKDGGIIPNHPAFPLIVYKRAVELPDPRMQNLSRGVRVATWDAGIPQSA